MARTNQGGSVVSFAVIGVVLIALVLGGAYLVHRHATGSLHPTQTPSSQQPTANQPQKQPSSEENTSNNKQPSSSQSQSNQGSTETAPQSSTGSSENTAELPQTGPSQLIASLLAVGLLSVAIVSYIRSRRFGLSL